IHNTNSLYNLSNVAFKSDEKPGCGREDCMPELFTAVIQRNFSSASNWAIGPLSFSPAHILANDSKFSFTCERSNSLQNKRIFSSGMWYSNRMKRLHLLNKIKPTLINSSRSILGTTRTTAYSYTTLSCILRG